MSEHLELNKDDIELIRQWFDAVQDLSESYLNGEDYLLARKIYERLGYRVPNSIKQGRQLKMN